MLVITEKPSVAESFSQALSAVKKGGYYESSDKSIVITYCAGHLYQQAKANYYLPDEDKKWTLDKLPIIPNQTKYLPGEGHQKQISIVNRLLFQHQKDKIIIATDADREGELIARITLKESCVNLSAADIWRFWSSQALTPDVIKEEMNKIKPWKEYEGLALQGYARQKADWLVGMNLTMLLSILNANQLFPVGRVQTAILAAIRQRNEEIKNFRPQPYTVLEITVKDKYGTKLKAELINPDTKKKEFNPDSEYVQRAIERFKKNPHFETQVTITKRKSKPPKLLSLTEISKVAADKLNLTAAQTLEIIQKLYEEYKCVSYPRTPSQVMGDDDVDLYLKKFNKLKMTSPFSKYSNPENIKAENKHIFDSKKLEAHHALIPLDFIPEKASPAERQVYSLIANRFYIACMDDHEYEEAKYFLKDGNFYYSGTVNITTVPGWSVIQRDPDEISKKLDINSIELDSFRKLNKMTEPKKQFTESSLLAFMKNPKGEENDVKLAGLGTEATRAAIITKLQTDNYVEKRNKAFYVTSKGEHLLTMLSKSDNLKKVSDVHQTTEWEEKLSRAPHEFVNETKEYIRSVFKENHEADVFKGEIVGTCPSCKEGCMSSAKYSYICDNEDCKFKINKSLCNSLINEYEMKLLLSGKTTRIKAFKKKNGDKFKAKLKYSFTENKIIFTK